MENIDDGSLACLGIDVVAETRQFNCAIVAQQKIVNTTFAGGLVGRNTVTVNIF